jgi:phage tail-like protein
MAFPELAQILKHDPLVASNFFLEIDGAKVSTLTEVSGLDVEVEVVEMKQTTEAGQYVIAKTLGQNKVPGDITVKRIAPLKIGDDPIWKWFNDIRDKGMAIGDRASTRKNGSIVVYDTSNVEVSRWNFYNAWPMKISSDSFSATSSEAVHETITFAIEYLERKK